MKIAVTGARGTLGTVVVKTAVEAGHEVVQVNRTEEDEDSEPKTENRTADNASSYEDSVKAFQGCDAVIHLAAIPNPVDKEDSDVHNNNVNSSFNGLRAAAECGINRFCYASSVNAIGLAYANQPLKFPYFPIDEDYPANPTDSYALAKQEAELQCRSFVNWFPSMRISCMRIHQVEPKKKVREEHENNWEESAVKQLFGWVSPEATARACLLAVERADRLEGCEIFNIIAPVTTQDTPSAELAKKYFPDAEIRNGWGKDNAAFWTSDKAKRILGWEHTEKE